MRQLFSYFKGLGVSENTIASITITLFTFSTGLFLSWLGKRIKNQKERKSYKKSLILILQDFSKACSKQDKVVTTSLIETGFGDNKNFIVSYVPIGTLDYLQKIDFNVFLNNFEPIFYKKHFSKAVSKLFELIAQIKAQNESARDNMKFLSDKYSLHERTYLENLGELRNAHDALGLELDGKPISMEDQAFQFQTFFKIFGEWHNRGAGRTLNTTYNQIISPTLKWLNQIDRPDERVLRISRYTLKCDLAYENIKQTEKMLKTTFENFAHFHKRASKLTNVIIKILR